MNTKLSVLILALFALWFSIDARELKDHFFSSYVKLSNLNTQWLKIFKKLPIGVIMS
jgi:hypothetical protein